MYIGASLFFYCSRQEIIMAKCDKKTCWIKKQRTWLRKLDKLEGRQIADHDKKGPHLHQILIQERLTQQDLWGQTARSIFSLTISPNSETREDTLGAVLRPQYRRLVLSAERCGEAPPSACGDPPPPTSSLLFFILICRPSVSTEA